MKFPVLVLKDPDFKEYIFMLELLSSGIGSFLIGTFPSAQWEHKKLAVKFTRKVDYYMIEGLVPVEIFQKINANIWADEIFPGGKRGPQGLPANTFYFDPDGKRIISQADFDKLKELMLHSSVLKTLHPAPPGVAFYKLGKGFIQYCEIYSLEGMQHFVSVLKENH